MREPLSHGANYALRARTPASEDWRKISTGLRYRGLEVTLIGNVNAGLLAIAGYGTRAELAIGAIDVKHHNGRSVYCLTDTRVCMTSAQAAAEAIVRTLQAREASEH
jgi:hypothetical protein